MNLSVINFDGEWFQAISIASRSRNISTAPSNFTQHPFPRGVQHPQSRYMALGFNIGISIDSWHLTIVTWSLVVIAMVYWVYRRFIPGFTAVHMSPPCFTACSYCSLMSGWCSNASLKISWDRCGRRPLRSGNWIKCSMNGYQSIIFQHKMFYKWKPIHYFNYNIYTYVPKIFKENRWRSCLREST